LESPVPSSGALSLAAHGRSGTIAPMRIPLTPFATRELILFGVPLAGAAVALAFIQPVAAVVVALLFLWVLWFFRDFERAIPAGEGVVVSPADGRVTDIDEVDAPEFIGGRARRIGIFLNVFNCHVNRAPYAGTVAFKAYTPGKFHNAMAPKSSELNERQSLGLETAAGRMLVRQIAGAIARRIVCPVPEGAALARGQRYGMIKFGSRTELYVSAGIPFEVAVKVGDVVKGGSSVLGRIGTAG